MSSDFDFGDSESMSLGCVRRLAAIALDFHLRWRASDSDETDEDVGWSTFYAVHSLLDPVPLSVEEASPEPEPIGVTEPPTQVKWSGLGPFEWTDAQGNLLARVIDNSTPVVHIVVPGGEDIWKGFTETIIAERWQHARRFVADLHALAAPSVAPPEAEPRTRPDGGTCHHECGERGCFRVYSASPLSGVYPDDEWPAEVVAEARERNVRAEVAAPSVAPPSGEGRA